MTALQDRLTSALADRYTIERELGRGGMATVFLARDLAHDRDVAIKVLHPDLALAVGADRFRREIDIASRLQHPHILALLDSGAAANSLYYVMPFVRGESLRDRIDREGQLGIDDAVRLACEVASALGFAHATGVVHRDIKPENILLEDGHAVVADFGIAHAVSASGEQKLTQTGVTLGTPTYMSPEQAFAEKAIDGRSDVYSLACVLYEMLAGSPPFTGPNAQAIMARHTMEQVPSITIIRQSVPEHVEEAVFRALAKTPADRFPTAEEFIEALRTPGARTGPRRTQRLGALERRRQRARRAIYSAMAVVPLLGAAATAWVYLRPANGVAMTTDSALARRVAVLYFDDLSGGGTLAPVADGLTEALIDELGQVTQLEVVSRNGVAPFRGSDVEPDSVGRALRVGTLVRGSVEPARDGSYRVTVRLVDAGSGADIDRATFAQPAANVLALRDSLSQKVAEFLRERIGDEVRLLEAKAGTRVVEAWTLAQRGDKLRARAESLWQAGDTVSSERAFRAADSLLARAEALDAAWAAPTVGRGVVAYRHARVATSALQSVRLLDSALAHSERALARNARDPRALELRGTVRVWRVLRDLEPDPVAVKATMSGAKADLLAATTIDPTSASAWERLSVAYYLEPDFTEATLAARRAYEEDAYLANAADVLWRLYSTSYDQEKFPDASKWCQEGYGRFSREARFVDCQLWLLSVRGATPDLPRAWQLLSERKALTPEHEWPLVERHSRMLIAGGLARAGLRDSAERVLVASRGNPGIDPERELVSAEAVMRILMGDKDGALRLVKEYLAANPAHREGLARSESWWWRDLQTDPRFLSLVGRTS